MNFRMMASQIADVKIFGSSDPEIDAVCYDSRAVREGSLFAALRGEVTDGHKYIEKAILKGASAILAEEAPTDGGNRVPWLLSGNSRIAMAEAAIAIQGNPSASLKVAGITGTNGKTTTDSWCIIS